MKLFKRETQKKSLTSFKESTALINDQSAIDKITGGRMDGCHAAGVSSIFDNYSTVGTGAFKLNQMNVSGMRI